MIQTSSVAVAVSRLRYWWAERDWRTDTALVLLMAGVITLLAFRIFPVWTDDAVFSQLLSHGFNLHEHNLDQPLGGQLLQLCERARSIVQRRAAPLPLAVLGDNGPECPVGVATAVSHPAAVRAGRGVPRAGTSVMRGPLGSDQPVVCQRWTSRWQPLPSVLSSGGDSALARPRPSRLAIAAVLVFLGGQLREYSLPTTVVAAVILVLRPWWGIAPRSALRRGIVSAGVLLLAAVLSYAIYHSLGDALSRQRVRPELVLTTSLSWRLKILLPRLLSQFWLAIAGAVTGFIGRVRFDSLPTLVAGSVGRSDGSARCRAASSS